jgi:hypothetical protein
MKTLNTFLAALRVLLGWGDLSETRLSPAHGWLLRDAVPALAVARRPSPKR